VVLRIEGSFGEGTLLMLCTLESILNLDGESGRFPIIPGSFRTLPSALRVLLFGPDVIG
jgi:hypothetical protein